MKANWWEASFALRDLAKTICMSLVCQPYVTGMYSYVTGMSLLCTRVLPAFHSYVLEYNSHVIHIWFHHKASHIM